MQKIIFKKIIITILTLEAKLVLFLKKPTIIAITGSVGKTSTKDAMYTVCQPYFSLYKTEKSYNSDLGIPLSILHLPNQWGRVWGWLKNSMLGFLKIFSFNYPNYLVLEIGADHPGDISTIARWVKPKYSVFTTFPLVPVHIEFFKNREEVIHEKESLAVYTQKNGVLILNHDDSQVLSMQTRFNQRTVTYGESLDATLSLIEPVLHKDNDYFIFSGALVYKNETIPFSIQSIIAKTQILSALPGILVLLEEGYTFKNVMKSISNIKPTEGRLFPLHGIKNSILIDDTYNSSPIAVSNAISVLESLPNMKRKIIVLGDMLELGIHTEEEHRKIGNILFYSSIDIVVCIGQRSKFTYETLKTHPIKEIRWFESSEKAGLFLKEYIQDFDCILFKGSQSVRVEKALRCCIDQNSEDLQYLIRQDTEWSKR